MIGSSGELLETPCHLSRYGSGSLHSLSSDDSAVANHSKSEGEEEGATVPAPAPGILQVRGTVLTSYRLYHSLAVASSYVATDGTK